MPNNKAYDFLTSMFCRRNLTTLIEASREAEQRKSQWMRRQYAASHTKLFRQYCTTPGLLSMISRSFNKEGVRYVRNLGHEPDYVGGERILQNLY